MKLQVVIATLIFTSIALNAQNKSDNLAWQEGKSAVTIGYGLPNLWKSILKASVNSSNLNSTNNNGTSSSSIAVKGSGPFFAKYDYALTPIVGLGAAVGFWNIKVIETDNYLDNTYNNSTGNYTNANYTDINTISFNSLSIGARLNFHFGTSDKLDPYAGIAGGFTSNSLNYKFTTNNPNGVGNGKINAGSVGVFPLYIALTAGLRYYFTDNVGIYGEIGIDKLSVLQGGLAIKF